MKKAIVLAGGLPQIDLIKKLKKREYDTILIDYQEKPLALPYADKFYRESTLDVDEVRKITIEEKADILITCCTDQALATVSQVSEELSLPCYVDSKIGSIVTNKGYMKKVFWENNIPTAKYQLINDINDRDKVVMFFNNEYPLVVKPVDCNSSKGVIKVDNYPELIKALENALKYSRSGKAIVEEYIEGQEISVDAFVVDGISKVLATSFTYKIKDKYKFVIYKGEYPARISSDVYEKIKKITQKIVKVFNLKNSPLLIQTIVKENEIYVIEFSARTGGGVKDRMIENACGVDVITATIDLYEKKQPNITPKYYDGYVVDEFIYCSNGILDHVRGLEVCKEKGWLQEAYQLKNKGDKFIDINNSGDRVVALVYKKNSYTDYIEAHNKVIENINIYDINGKDIMRRDLLPRL